MLYEYKAISKPYVKIRPKDFTFNAANAACMQLMPDVEYVQFFHNFKKGQLIAAECGANDDDSIPWRLNCTSRKIREKRMKWAMFYKFICGKMDWINGNEYTIPAIYQEIEGKRIIFFDLSESKESSPFLNLKLSDLHLITADGEL